MHPLFHRFHEAFHHHHHHHMARHGHRGFSGFGGRHGVFGGPSGPGFDGLGRGRKLGSADLQLLLLALLSERPSHGYELIKALEERSNGYYVPSPGMVYPALTYLEEIGHARVEAQGAKKLYSITDTGRAHLDGQRGAVDSLLEQLAVIGRRMDEVRRAMGEAAGAEDFDMASGLGGRGRGRGRGDAGGPEVHAARHDLRSALVDKAGAGPEEQRRIADILERAASEIRGTGTPK
jgi:DNA-binding PadR family transcriptional regulator